MLILASSSPRRRELLAQAGLQFEVHAAHIDETRLPGEHPEAYVRRLALEKAQAVLSFYPEAIILGADTTVALGDEVMAKPEDRADAERMLRTLSGRTHQVHTGIAVVTRRAAHHHVETTDVTFSAINENDLQTYLDSPDPLDKAGAYGIQGYAARWIPRIDGDYFNVVGLPIAAAVRLIATAECT